MIFMTGEELENEPHIDSYYEHYQTNSHPKEEAFALSVISCSGVLP